MPTDPFVYNVPRKLTNSELASAIRLDIQSESDATSLYQSHYDATDDPRARAVLAHIRDEEKEHMSEFLQLLAMLDATTGEELRAAPQNVAGILSGGASNTAPGEIPAGNESDQGPSPLTVGSLMGQSQR